MPDKHDIEAMKIEPTALPNCLTIFHDGSCALCQREIALVSSLEAAKGVIFADVSGLDVTEVAPGLTARDAMKRFHVRRTDGTVLSGAAAFIEMWSLAPRLRFLKPLQNSPAALKLLNGVYRGFLVVRPPLSRALGRYDSFVWHGRPALPAGSPQGESKAPMKRDSPGASKEPTVNERFPDRTP